MSGVRGLEQLARARHGLGRQADVAVRDDVVLRVAIVELRLEDLHPLAGDLRPADAADQLLALPAEHAAGDHFDPALIGPAADNVHRESPLLLVPPARSALGA